MSTKAEDDFLSFSLLHFNLKQVLMQQTCLPHIRSLDDHLATIQTQIQAQKSSTVW